MSLNKSFEKIENPLNGSKKGCLWGLNPDKCKKVEEECKKCRQRDLINIKLSMSRPEDIWKIERGEQRLKKQTTINQRKTISQTNVQANGINRQSTDQLLDSFLQEWPLNNSVGNYNQEVINFFIYYYFL